MWQLDSDSHDMTARAHKAFYMTGETTVNIITQTKYPNSSDPLALFMFWAQFICALWSRRCLLFCYFSCQPSLPPLPAGTCPVIRLDLFSFTLYASSRYRATLCGYNYTLPPERIHEVWPHASTCCGGANTGFVGGGSEWFSTA